MVNLFQKVLPNSLGNSLPKSPTYSFTSPGSCLTFLRMEYRPHIGRSHFRVIYLTYMNLRVKAVWQLSQCLPCARPCTKAATQFGCCCPFLGESPLFWHWAYLGPSLLPLLIPFLSITRGLLHLPHTFVKQDGDSVNGTLQSQ